MEKQNFISTDSFQLQERTAVILANMGAPDTEKEMKTFLKRMFRDKAIIYAPALVRLLVSEMISTFRYKSSWQKYMLIGGSPLQKSMNAIASDFQKKLPDNFSVHPVYSYSAPFIEQRIKELYADGIRQFFVLSMYPQASFSTSGSVASSLQSIKNNFRDIRFKFIEDFYDNKLFVQYWVDLIRAKKDLEGYQKPFLLFSAHAIPQSFIERGDQYAAKMEKSAQLIANQLGLAYGLSYQSKIGPTNWTKPYTLDKLTELSENDVDEIIVVPLSFVNENLETRYDLDTELIPFSQNKLKIKNICRVEIPVSDGKLVSMFQNFITSTK